MIEFTAFTLHTVILSGYNTHSDFQRLAVPAVMLEAYKFITVLKESREKLSHVARCPEPTGIVYFWHQISTFTSILKKALPEDYVQANTSVFFLNLFLNPLDNIPMSYAETTKGN